MNGWVRSQDKKGLTLASNVQIEKSNLGEKFRLLDMPIKGPSTWLGSFETEARAIEVIDSINDTIIWALENGIPGWIYNIPQDDGYETP